MNGEHSNAPTHGTTDQCPLIGDVIHCQCGKPSSHYGTMGVRGAREVREETKPYVRKAYSDPKGGPEYDAP